MEATLGSGHFDNVFCPKRYLLPKKIFAPKRILGPKTILVRKIFGSKTILGPKEFLGTLGNRVKCGAYGGEGWGDQFLSLKLVYIPNLSLLL